VPPSAASPQRPPGSVTTRPLTAREFWWVALLCALAAAWPLRGGLLRGGGAVAMAVDTGTAALPWSAVLAESGETGGRPRNPELSDQGVCFYPLHRFVARSWLGGDPPLWCPDIYCGAPALGNPQVGLLDPQVLFLVAAEALFGLDGFHATIDLAAWLRLTLAGLGAYCLARVLGLGPPGSALTAVGFGLSAYLVLWLHHSLGHSTPWLPWVWLGLEGTRGARPRRSAWLAGAALWLSILGGHPETAFYVGAAAGLVALCLWREDRRAGRLALAALALGSLAAAPLLLPFLEYLGLSAAQEIRAAAVAARDFPWAAVPALLGLGGGVALLARGRGALRLLGAVALLGGALGLRAVGLPAAAGVTWLADRFGRPGDGAAGWFGPGTYTEEASGWLPTAVLLLAAAALVGGSGRLRRRGLVLGLGFGALALVLRLPGLLELKQTLPVVGLGATVRLAAVSALGLSLAAGAALEWAGPRARRSGALLTLILGAALLWPADAGPPPPAPAGCGANDAELGFLVLPEPVLQGSSSALEGWIAPEVLSGPNAVQRLTLRAAPVRAAGELDLARAWHLPTELLLTPSPAAAAAVQRAPPPEGARFFRTNYLQVSRLGLGHWRFDVLGHGADSDPPLFERCAAQSEVRRAFGTTLGSWLLLGAGVLAVLLPATALSRWATVLVALLHGLWFARGVNPVVPAAEIFPATATETIVRREQGVHRFFSDPSVLVPDTGLVRGLRALDGYDGMDPADFNRYRGLVMQPGVNALLGWNARGVDLDAPAFDLLGVGLLVLASPLDHADWEQIAGPNPAAPEFAETWIYRHREPFPRAFVATAAVPAAQFATLAGAGAWDPRSTAIYDGDWRPTVPATTARAALGAYGNTAVEVEVELDGDGLLVLTDQFFPGWAATVDGEVRPVERVNAIFRGVALRAGDRLVRFEYRPRSLTLGLALAALALVAAAGLSVRR
jgi:hypothetical protein